MSKLRERLQECVESIVNEIDYDIYKEAYCRESEEDNADVISNINNIANIILQHFPELKTFIDKSDRMYGAWTREDIFKLPPTNTPK
jgi:hypothetical protein